MFWGEGDGAADAGEASWPPGTGPEARDGDGNRVGEFAYAVVEEPRDFALVRLDDGVPAGREMCVFGGPTGINADRPATPVVLQYVGSGALVGEVMPARQGLALGMPDPDHASSPRAWRRPVTPAPASPAATAERSASS